ncbi:hypothetical protein QIS74_10483 [Colletotrichum tabaci]|uniref:Uncharacterized protein n=1 Tax=Colletotrichum tabaci TaxID=1209068 RepID=A0AAV9T1E0_9PEZI
MDVATLVAQMNEALASIHATIEGLSTSAAESDTRLDELEQKRDMTLAELKAAYEKEQQELAAARQKELDDIAEQRRREDEEREARRRREDEELAARKAKEDEEKKGTFDTTTRNVEDEMDDLMDSIEEETAKKIAQGEAKLAELEEKRRELNRLIEEQMKAAVPPIPTRKRARTVRNSSAVPSAEPSPLPPAETLAEHAAGNKGVEEQDSIPGEGTAEEGLEGDDSRPHPEEPVAEKNVEEGASTEGTQPGEDSGETPPTETVSPEEPAKDETSPREPAIEADTPAEASEPEAEPAPAEDTNQETAPDDVGDSSSVLDTEDHKEDVPDEVEETSAEVPDAALSVENSVSQSEMPETTSRSATAEEPVAEEPPTEETPTEEHAPATITSEDILTAEEASAIEETPALEATAAGETPAGEATEEETPATEDTPAEEAPETEETSKKAHSEDGILKESPESVEASVLERGASDDDDEEDVPVEENATAPEPAETVEEPEEQPTGETTAVEPSEEQPADQRIDASPEPSPVSEDENTPMVVREQATGEDVDETVREDSTPEFSIRAVADAEKVVEEAQPETNDEQAEAHLGDAHDVPDIVLTPVAEESGEKASPQEEAPLQDEDVTAAGSPVADESPVKDEADFQERTQLEDDTVTLEASSAEPTEPLQEAKNPALGETAEETDALATEDVMPEQEYNQKEETEASLEQQAPEDVTVQDEVFASQDAAAEMVSENQDNSQLADDTPQAETPNEPESLAEETAFVQEDNSHDEAPATDAQGPEDSPLSEDTLAPKTPVDEVTLEQEPLDAEESPAQEEIPGEDEVEVKEVPNAQDTSKEEESAKAEAEDPVQGEASIEEKAEATAADGSYQEETGPEIAMETTASETIDTREVELAKAEPVPEKPDPEDAAASPNEDITPDLTAETDEAQEKEDVTKEASQDAAVDGFSEEPVNQENAPSDSAAQAQLDAPEGQVDVNEPAQISQEEGEAVRDQVDGDQTDDADGSVLLDSQDEVKQTQLPRSEDNDDQENQSLSEPAGHQPEETSPSEEHGKHPPSGMMSVETEEQDAETSATAPFHDEAASPLTQVHEEDFNEFRKDQDEVTNSIVNEETIKTELDDAQEHEFKMTADEDDINDMSHVDEYHQHDDSAALKESPSHEVDITLDPTQPESHHAEVGVVASYHQDASFDDADRLSEPDIDTSAITEITEPDAPSVDESSGEASIVEAYFHPESVGRDISADPDATFDSSYMAEPLSMAADQSYELGQHHDSFLPNSSVHDHREDSEHFASRQVLFDEEEYNGSSPARSVEADNDVDEPSEDSYNPFARARATSFEQPAYQPSDNIPYNPFALQTVIEEETPQESHNPFARRTVDVDDEVSEASYNPFTHNTTTSAAADNFLRSASALGHSQPSSPEQTFARSASAQGRRRDSVSSNNPFARSMKADDQKNLWSTTAASTRGQHEAATHSSNNPFARSASAQGYYEPNDADTESETDDEEALAAAEATYKNLFPAGHGSPNANNGFVSAAQGIERRQPTPQVPDSMYNNPFASRRGDDVDEARFHRGLSSSPAGGHDYYTYSDADAEGGLDGRTSPVAHHFVQESSPISARHLAPTNLESIQERYNSELEDMDSESEGPESLTTSQQLPGRPQSRGVVPAMPSIAERSHRDFDGSDEEGGDWDPQAHAPRNSSQIDASLTSSEYRPPPPPTHPPHVPNSQDVYSQEEVGDSSEDDGDIFRSNPAPSAHPSTFSPSQYSATPHHEQQQAEDSLEEERDGWDDALTAVQPSTHPTAQLEATEVPHPPPPRAVPGSQGFHHHHHHHQEQPDSSEDDEAPHSQNIARPGQFPFSSSVSSSQFRAASPPTQPLGYAISQVQDRQDFEGGSEDGEDARDSNATRPGQIPTLSTSQYRETPPPPPPPPRRLRVPSAQDRHHQDLQDSDSGDENEEAWEANTYGQTTDMMGESSLMGNNGMEADTGISSTPPGSDPMMPDSPVLPPAIPARSAFRESVLATSSQGLQSRPREEDGGESDDSWENIGQRGEANAVGINDGNDNNSANNNIGDDNDDNGDTTAGQTSSNAATPQLRVDSYEQRWPNGSNDQISTASTLLQPSGPGDFTDTESQGYVTPLPSAGFSASSQYTQAATDSPRHPDSGGMKDVYDQSYNRGAASSPYDQDISTVSYGHASSLAEELARDNDDDDDDDKDDSEYDSEYDHTQAPAFLTQIGTAQQQHEQQQLQQQLESNEPVLEQVVDSFHSDDDDDDDEGPKTAVISTDGHPLQYASARFGATSWRDELRSPTLFGATRHSRSGSLREEFQRSLHQDAEASHPSPLQSAYQIQTQPQPEEQRQDSDEEQPSQVYHQEPFGQQAVQTHGQETSFGQQPSSQVHSHRAPEPEVQVTEVEAEEAHEQTTPQLAPQSEHAPDISPLALQQESPATPSPSRGLAFSRHNPDRPQTPPAQSAPEEEEEVIDPELMIPRDVTNVPWHARTDSVPHSMRSQSTIDSIASSPVHSALHADKHEPVIRDSWPASVQHLTRPRNDSALSTDRDRDDYDPFRFEGAATAKQLVGAGAGAMRAPSGSIGSSSDSPPRNTASNGSPGSLISRMRGIFENAAQAKQEPPTSPVRSRPVSGVFHSVRRGSTKPGGEVGGGDGVGVGVGVGVGPGTGSNPAYGLKAGFLNEAEDEADEKSALLRSSTGGLEAN